MPDMMRWLWRDGRASYSRVEDQLLTAIKKATKLVFSCFDLKRDLKFVALVTDSRVLPSNPGEDPVSSIAEAVDKLLERNPRLEFLLVDESLYPQFKYVRDLAERAAAFGVGIRTTPSMPRILGRSSFLDPYDFSEPSNPRPL